MDKDLTQLNVNDLYERCLSSHNAQTSVPINTETDNQHKKSAPRTESLPSKITKKSAPRTGSLPSKIAKKSSANKTNWKRKCSKVLKTLWDTDDFAPFK